MKTSILLAEDHQVVREGVRALLEERQDIGEMWEASNGEEAVALARKHRPQLAIMDISMPGMNGIEATRRIRAVSPRTRVIAFSMHSERVLVTEVMEAGAEGFVLKDAAFEELAHAIEQVAAGKSYISPRIAHIIIRDMARRKDPPTDEFPPISVLTEREREVLALLANGKSTKEMSDSLSISGSAVESHRRKIKEKLGIRSTAGLTKYAIREGLSALETRNT